MISITLKTETPARQYSGRDGVAGAVFRLDSTRNFLDVRHSPAERKRPS